ncbi:C-C motif chemokine 20 [Coregonus clupeaformis]|uniref:Chemokine interleukin-8-like domain-containing protein n=1 Tax=Coregonus suidteri TaxID=861788 RepID=A0AAN8L1D4_9TELE|nr:C-C motif chemokine 20 [Coregonus clupeaformis]
MAPRYLETILFLCCVVTMFSSTSAAYGPRKLYCCVEYQEKPVPYQQIKGYKLQSSKEVCNINAIIFYTLKNKKVCASVKDEWVRKALARLSFKLKKMSGSNTVTGKTPHPDLKGTFNHSNTTFSNITSNHNIQ